MSSRERIRVLVVDDSAFSRRSIVRMLERSPQVEVVGAASDGDEALRMSRELDPDLITLDLEMPRMDGFTFLRLLMANGPVPVMVISGRSADGDVFNALDLGAVDFIAKPCLRAAPELRAIEAELLEKVHAIRELRIDKVKQRLATPPPLLSESLEAETEAKEFSDVVVIGSSTGGPAAIMQTLAAFAEPPNCPILIAQHMPAGFTGGFAERLDRMTPFRVKEAEGGEVPLPGSVLLAPGGRDLVLANVQGQVQTRVVRSGEGQKYVPSVDRLFETAAEHFGPRLLGILLTGMGNDGCRGAEAIQRRGGRVIAESEETAVIFGMPRQAIRVGAVDRVIPLHAVPAAIRSGVALAGLDAGEQGWSQG